MALDVCLDLQNATGDAVETSCRRRVTEQLPLGVAGCLSHLGADGRRYEVTVSWNGERFQPTAATYPFRPDDQISGALTLWSESPTAADCTQWGARWRCTDEPRCLLELEIPLQTLSIEAPLLFQDSAGERCLVQGDGFDELCDEVDNDCDGQIDEELGLDLPCEEGEGLCLVRGRQVCDVNGSVSCQLEMAPQEGEEERCDGVDNDCDGQIDEALSPAPCTLEGRCGGPGERRCVMGELLCERLAPPEGSPELCNGEDDDCDEMVDEDFQGLGEACAGERAGCGRSELRCDQESGESYCAIIEAPPSELCNGLDDDCDGRVDEDFPRASGERPCSSGTESCREEGVFICAEDGQSAECSAVGRISSDEICDQLDNDCDGFTDEGFAVGARCYALDGACRFEGVRRCNEDGAARCFTEFQREEGERCDAQDNDCDGVIDEGFERLGQPCEVGESRCRRSGQYLCADDVLRCSVEPASPEEERCDGLDNDCDGLTDEGFEVGEVCTRDGCQREDRGVWGCDLESGARTCTYTPDQLPDLCDGVDLDCDGLIDEAFVPVEVACPMGGCGARSVTRCEAGVIRDSCAFLPPVDQALDETCDGLDEDCDGRIDENFSPRLTQCGVGECIRNGWIRCVLGREVEDCSPRAPAPRDNDCDNRDEDCDGRADEGYQLTVPGACGLGVCRSDGIRVCEGGVSSLSCPPGLDPALQQERCANGLDDDCDGRIDERPPGEGSACALADCVIPGVQRCAPGAIESQCVLEAERPVDSCDGVDSDCDGAVDEDSLPTPCDAVGEGICGEGTLLCEAGALRCAPRLAEVERCNGLDDDCDGESDETVAPERCNGLDDDCDGATDEDWVCGATLARGCSVWLGWADRDVLGPAGPTPTWGSCPVSDAARREQGNNLSCNHSRGDERFHMIETGGIVDYNDWFAIRFACDASRELLGVEGAPTPEEKAQVLGWFEANCSIALAYEDAQSFDFLRADSDQRTSIDLRPTDCPAHAPNNGVARCVKTGANRLFHPLQAQGRVNEDDVFGLAFFCEAPAEPERAREVTESIDLFLSTYPRGGDTSRRCEGRREEGRATWGADCMDDGLDQGGPNRCTRAERSGERFNAFFLSNNDPMRDCHQVGVMLRAREE
ncbi:MAG: MopE-related protein [Myxococcota bacterium]|nr:MopE-related protein [Myxococcota bacterium]